MAFDLESAIRGAISDTAFSSKNVQKPKSRRKRKESSTPIITPTAKPSTKTLLSNVTKNDIQKMKISDRQKEKLIRDKRAMDYAPGGKWGDNFVNRLFPGINDKYSLLSEQQLSDWYDSRGLNRGKFNSLNNVIKSVFGGGDKPTIVETPIPTTPKQRDGGMSFSEPYVSPRDIVRQAVPSQAMPGMSFEFARTPKRDASRIPSILSQFVDIPSANVAGILNVSGQPPIGSGQRIQYSTQPELTTGLLAQMQNELGSYGDVPTGERQSQIAFAPYNDYSTLITNENVGGDYAMNYSLPLQYRLQVGGFGNEEYDTTLLETMRENPLLNQYNIDINKNLPTSTLLNPGAVLFGLDPKINATGRFTAYTPGSIGVDEVNFSDLSGSQMIDYNNRLQELRAAGQALPNQQLNLLGFY